MSKLAYIRKVLEENQGIIILAEEEGKWLPGIDGRCNHFVDFYTAPRSGAYTVEELQMLIKSLVPGLAPSYWDDFRKDDDRGIVEFGILRFEEEIGEVTVRYEIVLYEIVLVDKDIFVPDGFVDGKKVVESVEKVHREVRVRLYPDAYIAATALSGGDRTTISKKALEISRKTAARLSGSHS